jgi:hypothetical protein
VRSGAEVRRTGLNAGPEDSSRSGQPLSRLFCQAGLQAGLAELLLLTD